MVSVEKRKAKLEERLSYLDARLHAIDDELDSHQSRDWEELAVERESDEVLEQLGISGTQEIQMIKAALSRVADGSYGECTKCGARISDARLDVLPFTPFCKNCAT
jgi:RNA polymerase-binding transcription factor DksA